MAKMVAAPPVAVVFHPDEPCSADELELDAARYCYEESVLANWRYAWSVRWIERGQLHTEVGRERD